MLFVAFLPYTCYEAMLMFPLPNARHNAGGGVELGVLLKLQSGSEHRTTGSQDEQREQEDD